MSFGIGTGGSSASRWSSDRPAEPAAPGGGYGRPE